MRLLFVLALVVSFCDADRLAKAYGSAVNLAMPVTLLLCWIEAPGEWIGLGPVRSTLAWGGLLCLDG